MPQFQRHWFRFNLRTLLFVVVALAIPLAWVAKERAQSRFELLIVERLGAGEDDLILGSPYETWNFFGREPQDWRYRLTVQILGKRVLGWGGHDQSLSDDELGNLAAFSNLQFMKITSSAFADQKNLGKLRKLTVLYLYDSTISDPSALGDLKQLQFLFLHDCGVTQNQVEAIKRALPDCTIDYTQTPKP